MIFGGICSGGNKECLLRRNNPFFFFLFELKQYKKEVKIERDGDSVLEEVPVLLQKWVRN